MQKTFVILALSLALTMPTVVFADNDNPIEIPLVEMVAMSGSIGDDASPLDSSHETGAVPADPTQFRAFIAGNTLSVSNSTATLPTQLIVRDNLGSVVVNRQFTQYAAQQMPVGAFTLELHTTSFTLQGYFEVNQ